MTSIDIIKVGTTSEIRMGDIPITSSSRGVAALMESDYIELSFVSSTPTFFEIGDYVNLADSKYDELHLFPALRKKYVVKDKQVPTYSSTNDVYEYKLRLDAYYWMWNNRVFKYRPSQFGQEASWSLTGTVSGFLEIYKDNLKAYGFGDYEVEIEQGYDYNIYVSFDGTLMIDALNSIISAINTAYKSNVEWWVEGNTIHIGDCNVGSPVMVTDEGDNKNAVSIVPKEADTEYSNRLIIFGGTQNLSPRYRKELWFQATTVSGNTIYDDIHKKFSPSWFKKEQREYPESEHVRFSTQMQGNRYWLEDYSTVGSLDAVTTITHVITRKSFNAVQQKFDFYVAFAMILAAKMEVDGSGHPDMASIKSALTFNSVDVTLRAVCENADASEEPIILATKSFKANYNQKVENPADQLTISSSWEGVNSAFVGNTWRFEVVCKGRINREEGLQSDVVYTSEGHTAVYALAESSISFLSTSTYRVNTTIKLKDGASASCVINDGFNDIFTNEAKRVKVIGLSVPQNAKYTFPDIVKGRVDAGYFVARESDGNVNSIVQKNLMLPSEYKVKYNADGTLAVTTSTGSDVKQYKDKNYIDAKIDITGSNELTGEKIVERIVVFDEIFPRMKDAAIDKVGWYKAITKEEASTSQTVIDEYGDVVKEHIFYQFVDNDFPFTEDCIIDGAPLKVTFQSGMLEGMTFAVGFPPEVCPSGLNQDDVRFEIIANTDYGIELPNDLAHPQVGDKYILSGWDVESMEGTGNLISQAEAELLEEGVKLVTKKKHDPHTYEVVLLSDQMYDSKKTFNPSVGCAVTLKNEYLFSADENNQRQLRVIGYEVKLDKNYDTARITVGEDKEYSRLKALERSNGKTEQSLTVYANNSYGLGGGGSASSVEWDNIKNKPVNIAGYGIVDAYINGGTITLGTNSLRPLTENDYEIIQKIAGSGFFEKVEFEEGKTAVRLKPEYVGLYSEGWLSAYGMNGTGSSEGGANVASQVWGDATYTASNALPANLGYQKINESLNRITALENRKVVTSWNDLTDKPSIPSKITELSGDYVSNIGGATGAISLLGGQTANGSVNLSIVNNKLQASLILADWAKAANKPTYNKSDVGLGNVENTSLSTWKGTTNITTLGTITSGTWHGSKIANAYLENNKMTLWGQEVELGGSTNGPITIKNGTKAVTLSVDTNGFLKVDGGLYATSFVSAYGLNNNSGGGNVIGNRLDRWSDYNTNKATWVLSALLGNELHIAVDVLNVSHNSLEERFSAAMDSIAVSMASLEERLTGFLASAANMQEKISDIATIRSNAANGNTAYSWGNHASQGYLLASTLTKSMIQSTLGISNWALAATKPVYKWSEITEKPNIVNTIGDKSGAITLLGGQTGAANNGKINLTMSGNQLQASIVGLATAAYHSHEAYITELGTNGNYVTIKKGDGNPTNFTVPYATTASKLSITGSYTAWGQTYFANGVPITISGNMTSVGTISANGDNTITKSGATDTQFIAKNGYGTIALLASSNRGVYDSSTGRWLIGTNGTDTYLGESGKFYFSSTNNGAYIEYKNGAFHFSKGIYSDSFISAYGLNGNATSLSFDTGNSNTNPTLKADASGRLRLAGTLGGSSSLYLGVRGNTSSTNSNGEIVFAHGTVPESKIYGRSGNLYVYGYSSVVINSNAGAEMPVAVFNYNGLELQSGKTLKIGSTTLNEDNLKNLLNLLN